jgi:protein ImuB
MSYVCLWSPAWRTGAGPGLELGESLLAIAPRVAVERRGVVWADARGLPAEPLALELAGAVAELQASAAGEAVAAAAIGPGAGVAAVPVAAELAARLAARAPAAGPVVVPSGRERDWTAPLPLSFLEPGARLTPLLDGVGLTTCGELAALDREAVEVRFGSEGVALWRLARCEDERRLFTPAAAERPRASLDFIDYVVTDPERLVFTAHALLGSVLEVLRERGEHARRLRLRLPLANGEVWEREIRSARSTASREAWLRLIRGELERITVPDAIAGVALELEATEPASAIQGDLFDRGFATASAVEAALARLTEDHGELLSGPLTGAHPLLERREAARPGDPAQPAGVAASGGSPGLSLQLLEEPRALDVEGAPRRDHTVPLRYRERVKGRRRKARWRGIVTAAGPDRISGGQWEQSAYAREYFRCVTEDGALVWLFREGRSGDWYLHGWWD